MGKLDPEVARRGTTLHAWSIHAEDNPRTPYPPMIEGYAPAFLDYHQTLKPNWIWREQNISVPALGLAGRLDRFGRASGAWTVADLKTGGACDWHRLQLALYALLVEASTGRTVERRQAVYVRKDGTWKQVIHTDEADLLEARAMIAEFGR